MSDFRKAFNWGAGITCGVIAAILLLFILLPITCNALLYDTQDMNTTLEEQQMLEDITTLTIIQEKIDNLRGDETYAEIEASFGDPTHAIGQHVTTDGDAIQSFAWKTAAMTFQIDFKNMHLHTAQRLTEIPADAITMETYRDRISQDLPPFETSPTYAPDHTEHYATTTPEEIRADYSKTYAKILPGDTYQHVVDLLGAPLPKTMSAQLPGGIQRTTYTWPPPHDFQITFEDNILTQTPEPWPQH
jgi:hypothetical protein